jgi:hypothetical protein
VTLDCGPDCALSGVYECVGYFRAQKLDLTHSMRHRPWWVKGGESFDTPHGNHPEQFQIWFNQDHWRIGYSASYWYVNSDPDDWGGTKWLPQAVGSQKFPPDFVSLKANGGAPPLTITPSTNARENDYGEYFTFFCLVRIGASYPILSSSSPTSPLHIHGEDALHPRKEARNFRRAERHCDLFGRVCATGPGRAQ